MEAKRETTERSRGTCDQTTTTKGTDCPKKTRGHLGKHVGRKLPPVHFPRGPRDLKYGNKNTYVDGILFRSKREASRYCQLKMLQARGRVIMFLRQPLFDLGGGVTYRADFLVFWASGRVSFEDSKGYPSKEAKKNKALVEGRYPVEVEFV